MTTGAYHFPRFHVHWLGGWHGRYTYHDEDMNARYLEGPPSLYDAVHTERREFRKDARQNCEEVLQHVRDLMGRVEELEQESFELWRENLELRYAPGGPGYAAAKTEFEQLNQ